MAKVDERTITAERVRTEHLRTVHRPAHWAYLLVVLIGGTALMIALIALMAGVGS